MRRGTTPTITFTCPMTVTSATKMNVAFSQKGEVVIEKSLSDVTIDDKKAS